MAELRVHDFAGLAKKEKIVLVLALLSAVENKVPISELIIIILAFVGMLMLCTAVSSYIGANHCTEEYRQGENTIEI